MALFLMSRRVLRGRPRRSGQCDAAGRVPDFSQASPGLNLMVTLPGEARRSLALEKIELELGQSFPRFWASSKSA